MKRHLALAVAGLTTIALLAGCSDGKKSSFPGLGGTGSNDATLPGGVTLPQGNAELGSCHVKVEGDVTAEWTATGGASAVGYGPWVPSAAATVAGITLDETFFIVNCQGDGDNYVGFMPAGDSKIPMTPASYTIEPADNAFGASQTGAITTLLGLDGTDTNWGPSAPGQLVITAFDEHHVAGTFTIPVTDVLARLNGVSKGNAVITGEFDYTNPN